MDNIQFDCLWTKFLTKMVGLTNGTQIQKVIIHNLNLEYKFETYSLKV